MIKKTNPLVSKYYKVNKSYHKHDNKHDKIFKNKTNILKLYNKHTYLNIGHFICLKTMKQHLKKYNNLDFYN